MKLAKFIDLIKSGKVCRFSKPNEIEALAAFCFFRFPGIPLESFEKKLTKHIDFSFFIPVFKELSSKRSHKRENANGNKTLFIKSYCVNTYLSGKLLQFRAWLIYATSVDELFH